MRPLPVKLCALYKWTAFRITVIYLITGSLWILYSDYLLYGFVTDPTLLLTAAIVKGWFYVLITSLMLYTLIQRTIKRIGRAEQAQAESEMSYRELSESITDIFIALDSNGIIRYWNKAAGEFSGHPAEEALGQDFYAFLHGLEREGFVLPVFDVLKKNERLSVTREIVRRGGRYCFDIYAYPSENGQVIFARDVTQQEENKKRLQSALKEMSDVQESIVNVFSSITERKDPYIAGHQHRTADLAVKIAEEMELGEDRVEGVRIAALLHDIGKMIVPAEIMSKPGKLSDYELKIVRLYPKASYEILKPIRFPWPVAEIALEHQERLNGTGYPLGMRGEEMLLESKIIAVADAVDAATSHRPYRPAKNLADVLRELREGKGTLYEPEVVDACVKVLAGKVPVP